MPRKGKDLEQLVAVLEKCRNKIGMNITSPDYIVDKITGNTREIDVSIRGIVESREFLTILECRDRKRLQDVQWIEQLAGKRDGVGADKAIAVSSSRFTSGAIKKANFLAM